MGAHTSFPQTYDPDAQPLPSAQFGRLLTTLAATGFRENVGNVVVVSVGDSLASNVTQHFVQLLGVGEGGQGFGMAVDQLGATLLTGQWTKSVSGKLYSVAAGNTPTWGYNADYVLGTDLEIAYIKGNYGAGVNTFKVQSQAKGSGSWVDEVTVDCHNAGGEISAWALVTGKPLQGYLLRVVGLTGTCLIVGARILNKSSGSVGFVLDAMGCPGANITEMSTVSPAILNPIMAHINPVVVTSCAMDTAAPYIAALPGWHTLLRTAAPDADFCFIGIPPVNDPSGEADNILADAATEALCKANNYAFVDSRRINESFAVLEARGWNFEGGVETGVHTNQAEHIYRARVMAALAGIAAVPAIPLVIENQTSSGTTYSLGSLHNTLSGLSIFGRDLSAVTIAFKNQYGDPIAYMGKTSSADANFPNAIGFFQSGRQVTLGATGFGLYTNATKFWFDLSGNQTLAGDMTFLTAGKGVVYASGVKDLSGTGSPEGVVTAPVGSTFRRSNGGAGSIFYVKETGSGNTGWVVYTAPGGASRQTVILTVGTTQAILAGQMNKIAFDTATNDPTGGLNAGSYREVLPAGRWQAFYFHKGDNTNKYLEIRAQGSTVYSLEGQAYANNGGNEVYTFPAFTANGTDYYEIWEQPASNINIYAGAQITFVPLP